MAALVSPERVVAEEIALATGVAVAGATWTAVAGVGFVAFITLSSANDPALEGSRTAGDQVPWAVAAVVVAAPFLVDVLLTLLRRAPVLGGIPVRVTTAGTTAAMALDGAHALVEGGVLAAGELVCKDGG